MTSDPWSLRGSAGVLGVNDVQRPGADRWGGVHSCKTSIPWKKKPSGVSQTDFFFCKGRTEDESRHQDVPAAGVYTTTVALALTVRGTLISKSPQRHLNVEVASTRVKFQGFIFPL